MLTTIEPLGRKTQKSTKEDDGPRGIPNQGYKCENIANVTRKFKNNGLTMVHYKLKVKIN